MDDASVYRVNGGECELRQWALGGLVLAAAWIGSAGAEAVDLKPDDVIASRQAGFDLQAGVMAAMKAGVDSGSDVKQFEDGAKGLASWGKVIPAMFPDGTQTGHDTKAKAAVWSDQADFAKAAANFDAAAEKLQTIAASDDKDAFAAQFKATGAACGACHRQFRER